MPPHLHPRSTATSTLFAGTLLASFIVVAIPHILPCPSRRKIGYQDTEIIFDANGKPMARRLRNKEKQTDVESLSGHGSDNATASALSTTAAMSSSKTKSLAEEAELFRQLRREAGLVEVNDRECPVPKPRTLLGRLMGKDASST